jgi:predicted dehydrogenase
MAQRWGTSAFASLEELLGARPDAIHVLLPPDLHAKLAIACLEGGAHAFVEKPLCISETECRELAAVVEKTGRSIAVNHNVTFEPPYLRLLEAVRQRKLGAIRHVAVFWSVPFGENAYGSPLYKKVGVGAAILETAPHPLSLIARLVGPARAASVTMTTETSGAGGMPDTWSIGLQCERGTAQCFLGIARTSTDTRVHVIGEDGAATVDLRLGTLSLVENTRFTPLFAKLADTLAQARDLAGDALGNFRERLQRLPSGGACDDGVPVFRSSIASFYAALRAGGSAPAGLDEGLATVRMCLAVIAAQEESKEVEPWAPAIASS